MYPEKFLKINRQATRFLDDFFDVMHQGLTLCMVKEEFFRERRVDDPGLYIESIIPDVERISGEKGQVAVWIAYCLHDMVA